MRVPRTARRIVILGVGLAVLWAGSIGVSLLFLPAVAALKNPRTSIVITVKDWKRKDHPFVVGPGNRHWTPIGAIPPAMKKAVVASEDANFYAHEGVDYEAIKEAIKSDIRKGRFARGGSTITQQVAKNIFLSREKTISRKIKEFVLARRIDDTLTKARIMELYLNVVELGPMVYGVGHASKYYFGKPASDLSARESSFLAAMLPGPKAYDPYRRMDRVIRRSDRILKRMFAARMIGEEEFRAALAEAPNVAGLERKVEKTMAAPPPEEPPPAAVAEGGLEIVGTPGSSTEAVREPETGGERHAPPGADGEEPPALPAADGAEPEGPPG